MSFRSGGDSEAGDLDGIVEHLEQENRGLELRLRYVAGVVPDLEDRVDRLESSVIFRFLRWLGPRLAWTGIPLFANAARNSASKEIKQLTPKQEYAEWAVHSAHFHRALSKLRVKNAKPGPGILVSIFVDLRRPVPEEAGRAKFENLVNSIAAQEHQEWELLVATEAEPPEWLGTAISTQLIGRRVEVLPDPPIGLDEHGFPFALDRCYGEFVVFVGASTVLEPDALHQLVAAAADDAVAAYSDWDHLDSAGRFHSPRFTPECSPELLRHAAYWGDCYLARVSALRQMNRHFGAGPLSHGLSLRLAATRRPVRRVPQMLWHVQSDAPRQIGLAAAAPSGAKSSKPGGVSIVICSRNPAHLAHCLETVSPTLGPSDEIIVIAHGSGEEANALERVTSRYNVQSVPYEGLFHFGLMSNLGAAHASGEAYCFLNDDAEPITPDWLRRMEAQLEQPDVGVVGALLLFPNRSIQHAGVFMGGGLAPLHVGRALTESTYWPWLRMTREVTAVTGACLAVRRGVWDELEGFDMRFPVNFNDIDLCLRASARGYRILLEAEAVLIHKEAQTRNPKVLAEELNLFAELWGYAILAPDRYFNPQLGLAATTVPGGIPAGLRKMQLSVGHPGLRAPARTGKLAENEMGAGR